MGGFLIIKEGVDIVLDNPQITVYRYSYDVPCDFYARNVQLLEGGHYLLSLTATEARWNPELPLVLKETRVLASKHPRKGK